MVKGISKISSKSSSSSSEHLKVTKNVIKSQMFDNNYYFISEEKSQKNPNIKFEIGFPFWSNSENNKRACWRFLHF